MSAIKELNWLDIDDEQKSRVVQELKDWHQAEIQDFVRVIRGQHEECGLVDNGWLDCWCMNDDAHCEVFQGPIEEFAEKLIRDGWAVESVKHFKALCPVCVNYSPEVSEEEEREDEAVYSYRKGEMG